MTQSIYRNYPHITRLSFTVFGFQANNYTDMFNSMCDCHVNPLFFGWWLGTTLVISLCKYSMMLANSTSKLLVRLQDPETAEGTDIVTWVLSYGHCTTQCSGQHFYYLCEGLQFKSQPWDQLSLLSLHSFSVPTRMNAGVQIWISLRWSVNNGWEGMLKMSMATF